MDNTTVMLIILMALLLLMLLLMLLKDLKRKLEQEQEDGFAGSAGNSEEDRRAEQAAKESYVRSILKSNDKLLLKQLQQLSGLSHEELQDMSADADLVSKIARSLELEDTQSLYVAATTKDIKSTSRTSTSIEQVSYPTNNIEPERLTDMGQLGGLTPESLAMPDDQFFTALATNDLLHLQSRELVTKRGLKAMLLDVSRSMSELMQNGNTKSIYARGVTYKLMSSAQTNSTDFLLRFFDAEPHPLMKAENEAQQLALMNSVRNNGFSGGGTNILGAIQAMVKDIKNIPGIDQADITLISDGQDNACDDIDELRTILGKNIKLHIIAIGQENPVLKAVAASYTVLH